MVNKNIHFQFAAFSRTLRQWTAVYAVVHAIVILQSGQIAEIGYNFTRSWVIADYCRIAAVAEYIETESIVANFKRALQLERSAFHIAKPEVSFERKAARA